MPARNGFSDQVMQTTAQWASWLAADWRQEAPIRIHSTEIAPDGSPQWHPDFMKWMTRGGQRPRDGQAEHLRTTRVMRRLRRAAVREYEVLYRVLVLNERLEDTTEWLNARARRNGIPLPPGKTCHYTLKDTTALVIAGIEYARQLW